MKVVVIGGGFAAVKFARTLRSKLSSKQCEIVLFNRENHLVFHPLLADVAGASINADAASAPLRQMLPGVSCRTERVDRIDLHSSEIEFDDGSASLRRMSYDHLVVACGAESNLGIIPGMSEHAFGFKVLRDAIDLRQHIVRQMEFAEASADPEQKHKHLSFIVVGAGFSGTEVAGEINELVRSSTRFYRNFKEEDVTVSMVHSQDQILPEVAPTLRDFARKKMEKAGITVMLNARAVAATHEGVQLGDGRMLSGSTIVCTIGTAPSPFVQTLDVPKERGRIRTAPDMRIEGQANAWAIGDCAYIINAFDNKPSPTTAQFAERQGRQAALNLVRLVKGEPTRPFHFKALGQLCSIGGYQAVAEMFGMRVSGFLAWFLWRGVYLFKLPTWSRRVKVALDWAWDLIFPRDLSFLNTDTTNQFTYAYFRPGDLIQRQGEPPRYFSVIDEGQVEILQTTAEDPKEKVLALMGKGDFFGEEALLGNRAHETSIRARSAVKLRQAGSALFSEIAGTFAPFRELMSNAIVKNSGNLWNHLPEGRSLLEQEVLSALVEPLPATPLYESSTLYEGICALEKSATGNLLIVDKSQHLWGTLDRNDLQEIVARIAVIPIEKRADITKRELHEFVAGNPLAVTLTDSVLTAYSTMLSRNLSWLPVVQSKEDPRPVGRLRADKIASRLTQKIARMEVLHSQVSA